MHLMHVKYTRERNNLFSEKYVFKNIALCIIPLWQSRGVNALRPRENASRACVVIVTILASWTKARLADKQGENYSFFSCFFFTREKIFCGINRMRNIYMNEAEFLSPSWQDFVRANEALVDRTRISVTSPGISVFRSYFTKHIWWN